MSAAIGKFEPGKVYTDPFGRRWRVIGFMTEPAVLLEDADHPHQDHSGFQVWGITSPLAEDLKAE
jgi:hypothetical protein